MTQTDTDVHAMTSDEALLEAAEAMTACPCLLVMDKKCPGVVIGGGPGCRECGPRSSPHAKQCEVEGCKGTGEVPLLEGMRVVCEGDFDPVGDFDSETRSFNATPLGTHNECGCQGRGWTPNPDLGDYLKAMRQAGFIPQFDSKGWWFWRPTRFGLIPSPPVEVTDDVDDKEAAYKAGLLAIEANGSLKTP